MTGAGGAVLVSSVAFALTWGVIVLAPSPGGRVQDSVTTAERCARPGSVELANREPCVCLERLEELRVVVDDRGGPAALEQSGGEAAHHSAVERVEEVEDRALGRDQLGRVAADHRDVSAPPEPLGRCRAELGVELDPVDLVRREAVEQPVERPALAAADVDDHVCRPDRDVRRRRGRDPRRASSSRGTRRDARDGVRTVPPSGRPCRRSRRALRSMIGARWIAVASFTVAASPQGRLDAGGELRGVEPGLREPGAGRGSRCGWR